MNKPIHIVHIIPALRFGGAERLVIDLINHSDPARFRYTIITFFDDNLLLAQITRSDVPVIVVPKKGKLSPRLFFDLARTFLELKPDIVHTHLFGADVWGAVTAWWLGIPVVTTEHNMNLDEGSVKEWIKRKLHNLSTSYVACSQAVAQYMKQTYGTTKPITVIQNGIQLDRFTGLTAISFGATVRLLILGRLTEQKGHEIAIRALSLLRNYSWKLTIVGDGPELTKIKNQITNSNLSERVSILPALADVPSIIGDADILLVPSKWEGLGVTALEAMAAGRTVIASRTGGLAEVIEDQKTGYLVIPNDVSALSQKLQWCFEHPSECKQTGDAAREFSREHFGIERMVKEYENVYEKIK